MTIIMGFLAVVNFYMLLRNPKSWRNYFWTSFCTAQTILLSMGINSVWMAGLALIVFVGEMAQLLISIPKT